MKKLMKANFLKDSVLVLRILVKLNILIETYLCLLYTITKNESKELVYWSLPSWNTPAM